VRQFQRQICSDGSLDVFHLVGATPMTICHFPFSTARHCLVLDGLISTIMIRTSRKDIAVYNDGSLEKEWMKFVHRRMSFARPTMPTLSVLVEN
jgi:hypothetical protein